MKFSERMIAKFGEARWEEMKKMQQEIENREMVNFTYADLLNHSFTNYATTGSTLSKDPI